MITMYVIFLSLKKEADDTTEAETTTGLAANGTIIDPQAQTFNVKYCTNENCLATEVVAYFSRSRAEQFRMSLLKRVKEEYPSAIFTANVIRHTFSEVEVRTIRKQMKKFTY